MQDHRTDRKTAHITPEEMAKQRQAMAEIRALADKPQTFCVVTYGCQMNAHDSEVIAGMLMEMGMTEAADRESADFVIFNTCCVRDNAERKALGNVTWLKEVRKRNPQLRIGVCGCMIQEPGMAERILKQYPLDGGRVVEVAEEDTIAEELPVQRLRRDAAYVTIMYGCNNFCSYCIVPYVRGRERSREMDDILREAESLQRDGVKEIMLLGQNVNSYGLGLDSGATFPNLLRRLDAMGIERLRFMTSHPKDLSDDLIDAMAGSRHILPQFHLPVQSGSDEVLRAMNRRYTRADYLGRVKALRSAIPDIGLTTDIIVGHPGETEEQFLETLSLVEEVGYDSAFTFIYSPRVGTRSAAMPGQIAPEVATDRIQRLIAVQERRQRERLQRFVGAEEQVLVEGLSRRSDTAVSGKGGHGISITLAGTEKDIGEIIPVRVTGVKNNTLTAERL